MTGPGEATETGMSGGRDARLAAEPPRLRLGDAAGFAVAAGSRVGGSIRGSGVESGSVAATPGVAVMAADPPRVTTSIGVPDGFARAPVEPFGERFTSEQPDVSSSAMPATALSHGRLHPLVTRSSARCGRPSRRAAAFDWFRLGLLVR
jgi:hypothetical protein